MTTQNRPNTQSNQPSPANNRQELRLRRIFILSFYAFLWVILFLGFIVSFGLARGHTVFSVSLFVIIFVLACFIFS